MLKLKSFLLVTLLSISIQDHCLVKFEKCVEKNSKPEEQTEPTNKIANCAEYENEDECAGCIFGYAVSYDGSQCIAFPNCELLEEGNKKCDECYDYFYPNSKGQCERTLCSEFEDNVCISCYDGYYLNKNNECQKITIPYCIKLDSDGKCSECVNHDEANDQGTCNIPATLMKGCEKYDKDGNCIKCNHYYSGPDENGNCAFKNCEADEKRIEYCPICQVGYDFNEKDECVAIDGSTDAGSSISYKTEYAMLIFILALLI